MNPFRFQGPIVKEDPESGCTLVHRDRVLYAIATLVRNGEYVQIVGPHQSGRTTLAIDLVDVLLSADDVGPTLIPVLVSCESLMDVSREGFIHTLLMRIARALEDCAGTSAGIHVESLLNLEESFPTTFMELHLRLRTLGDVIARSQECSALVIIMDEIETLPDALLKEVLVFFRGLFSHYEKRWEAPYRVISMVTGDLARLRLGKTSPYNISHLVPLDPFTRHELTVMLDHEHAGKVLTDVTFAEAAIERIYAESGGHPYFIQRLCHLLVERRDSGRARAMTVGSNAVRTALLELFEAGDETVRAVYDETPSDSEEWRLCERLASGYREPYAAIDPAISSLSEKGIVRDADHCCCIASGLYRRQILRRCFHERFPTAPKLFSPKEQLVAHIPCLQEILLNLEFRQHILDVLSGLRRDKRRRPARIVLALSRSLDEALRERKLDLDMDEIHAYSEYYSMPRVNDRNEVLSLLAGALVKVL